MNANPGAQDPNQNQNPYAQNPGGFQPQYNYNTGSNTNQQGGASYGYGHQPVPPQPQAPQPQANPYGNYGAPAQPQAANPYGMPAATPGMDPMGANPMGAGQMGGAFSPPPPPPVDPGDPNYNFGAKMQDFKTEVQLPPHSLNLDNALFLNLLAGSISLTKDEKKKIIESIPRLRQAQVDELIRIFQEERSKFQELSQKHSTQLKKLEAQHWQDWLDIEMEVKAERKNKEEAAKLEDLKQKFGLDMPKENEDRTGL